MGMSWQRTDCDVVIVTEERQERERERERERKNGVAADDKGGDDVEIRRRQWRRWSVRAMVRKEPTDSKASEMTAKTSRTKGEPETEKEKRERERESLKCRSDSRWSDKSDLDCEWTKNKICMWNEC
jgi:hypothetical protein